MVRVVLPLCIGALATMGAHADVVRPIRTEHEFDTVYATHCTYNARWSKTGFGKRACMLEKIGLDPGNVPIHPNCLPRHHIPKGKVRGAVLLYHGYTACPDAMMHVAERLAQEGMYVYSPLIVGHGRLASKSVCEERGLDCVEGDYVEDMVSTPGEYIDFVQETYEAFKKDVTALNLPEDAHIGVAGLSLGAALTAATLIEDSGTNFFTNALIMSPWLGLTDVLHRFVPAVILNTLTNKFIPPDKIPIASNIVDYGYGWGQGCLVERANGRAGYCNFRIKNILAAHSLTSNVLHNSKSITVKHMEAILVEKDGAWRNGVAAVLLRNVAAEESGIIHGLSTLIFGDDNEVNTKVAMCVYPFQNSTEGEEPCHHNSCRVPHSSLSRAENYALPPFGTKAMWWEKEIHNEIVGSLVHDRPVGSTHGSTEAEILKGNDLKRNFCYAVNIEAPPDEQFDNDVSPKEV